MAARLASKMKSPFRLAYVTDVEGNIDYFQRFVNLATTLSYNGDGELVLADGAYFIFGGDVVDKGLGDERLCRQLVSLKRKHPDRVFMLVGNRDLNKVTPSPSLPSPTPPPPPPPPPHHHHQSLGAVHC
jgi:hypothetical protein